MDLPFSADAARKLLSAGLASPATFRAALTRVPPRERDGWLDRVFGLDELPDDGPELPAGCVPYLPCSVDTLLRAVDLAELQADDVFVDLGCGLGRATALAHFLTGAGAIGIEIQPTLVSGARELASRLNASRVTVIEGDAAQLTRHVMTGSVFFLYCPFSGERLGRVVHDLESIARTRKIRVCTVGLTLPWRPWLSPVASVDDLAVYRSTW